MSGKITMAIATAALLGSTALATAQIREYPRNYYWGYGGYASPYVYQGAPGAYVLLPYGYNYVPAWNGYAGYNYNPWYYGRYNGGW